MQRKLWIPALCILMVATLAIPAMAAEEIKIGVLYPLTGGAAAEGKELRDGAELAVEIANNVRHDLDMAMAKNGGIKSLGGAKIKLIIQDHQGNPQLGADLAKKLIQDDKVVGLMGCLSLRGHQDRRGGCGALRRAYDQRILHQPGPHQRGSQMVSGAPLLTTPLSPTTCSCFWRD